MGTLSLYLNFINLFILRLAAVRVAARSETRRSRKSDLRAERCPRCRPLVIPQMPPGVGGNRKALVGSPSHRQSVACPIPPSDHKTAAPYGKPLTSIFRTSSSVG
jgi:hypothetical protein